MFMSLDEKDLNIVIDAMDQATCKVGEFIINEGDNGEVLYILESGKMSCHKVIGGQSKHLKDY